MGKRDPHEVLGVPRAAPVKEIRRAYRELARQLHPDASGTPETADAFHQATVAYNELKGSSREAEAIPVRVTVAPRRGVSAPGPRPAPITVEELASRPELDAEPLAGPAQRWRRTEAQDLASDLEIDADLELLLRLLRAGYFPF